MRRIMSAFHALTSAKAGGGILIALAFLMCTSITSAQVCEVYTDRRPPYPFIQDAIDDPVCTEIVLIVASPGETFTGPGNRDIDYLGRAVTIRSDSDDPTVCIIDCQHLGRGFRFHNNETGTSVLRGVTIRNGAGNYGGAIWCDNSSPSFVNCIVESSAAIFEGGGEGGGVHCYPNASPIFTDCIIRHNWTNGGGGGVSCYLNSAPTFVNCRIDSNWASGYGGGVSCSDNCSPDFTNCHIDSNSTLLTGGGVYCWSSSPTFSASCHIDSNTAGTTGGGVHSTNSSPTFSAGCHIDGNTAGTNGGGVCCDGGEPAFSLGCHIDGNTAGTNGGGVYFIDTDPLILTFGDSFIEDNSAGDYGGGVYCDDSSPGFDSCLVRLNTAETDDGGGIYCIDNSSPVFAGCRIDSNSAHLSGGGVYCLNGSNPEFTSCGINANTAETDYGGGVYCLDTSSPVFTSCGINGNSARLVGGGVYCENSSNPEFTSCQINANTALIGAGGVYCDESSPGFSLCAINYNVATGAVSDGGGLRLDYSSPTFADCEIDNNTASRSGGGMLCQASSSPTLDRCAIRGNSAGESGGGMWCSNSDPTVVNCIIIANMAGDRGGGVLCNAAWGAFEFCTLSDNVASGAEGMGGGVYCTFLSQTVFNSIIISFSEGSGIYFRQSAGCQVEYCDFYGNTGGDIAFYNDDPVEGPPVIDAISVDPLFVDRAGGDFHLTDDSECIGEAKRVDCPNDDFYQDNPRPDPAFTDPDIGADENRLREPITGIEDIQVLPSSYSLSQNRPNPFDRITRIEYALLDACHVELIIYNVLGERVVTLVNEEQSPGHKVVQWNARNQSGSEVASGIYFCRLEANDYTELKKMLLLK